ncbi:efflux RND transporter periplasmic adaptor subunit [Blastopirellula marina]|uniref:Multidrug resistance protein MexA n=1 Tax=Blastopirellula marina DSM 3645 TaxID=314230 RepID=A3ZPG8_9BACT|nr:efflux RND transporter periplasmic adaptor subunit [Blastopirellula marina]EAQ81646.1 multidrug resistance protein MexA [Blastopirellula marina DSM 3645]
MKISAIAAVILALVSLSLSGCESQTAESHEAAHSETPEASHGQAHGESHEEGHHEHVILVTSPLRKDVISTQQYVCQIHSCQHIEVRALEGGYLEEIRVNEGQAVKKGDLMFKILPTLFQAKLNAEVAEANRIGIELKNAQTLNQKGIVSPQELAIKQAELAKAQAKVELARAELDFTNVTAPFDGIVDRQHCQLGSLIEDGDVLTTFSDNSVMWVYFNVPESRYLEYKSDLDDNPSADPLQIELKLANGKVFPQPGKIGAIEADFNNTTGNIAFRADFDNPKGLLRNGQTGTILIHRTLKDVIVIPQRATYEILAKRYAFVVDKDNVVHQRDLTIESEQDDIFVIREGLEEGDKIILEGIRQVRDGDKIEFKYTAPEEVLGHLKYHAE